MESNMPNCKDGKFGDVITRIKKVHGLLDRVGTNIANIKSKVGQHHRSASCPPVDVMSEGDGKAILAQHGARDETKQLSQTEEFGPQRLPRKRRSSRVARVQNVETYELFDASGEGNSGVMERHPDRYMSANNKKHRRSDERRLSEPYRRNGSSTPPSSRHKSMIPRPFTPNETGHHMRSRCYIHRRIINFTTNDLMKNTTGHNEVKAITRDDDSTTPTNSPPISARTETSQHIEETTSQQADKENRPSKFVKNGQFAHRRILIARRSKYFSTTMDMSQISENASELNVRVRQIDEHPSHGQFTLPSQSVTSYADCITPKCFSSANKQREVMPFTWKTMDAEYENGVRDTKPEISNRLCATGNYPIVRKDAATTLDNNTAVSLVVNAKKLHTATAKGQDNVKDKYDENMEPESATTPISMKEEIRENASCTETEIADDTDNRAMSISLTDSNENANDALEQRDDVRSTNIIIHIEENLPELRSHEHIRALTPNMETSWLPSNLQPVIRERVKQFSENNETSDSQDFQEKITSSPISDKIIERVELYEKLSTKERDFANLRDTFLGDEIEAIVSSCLGDEIEAIVSSCIKDACAEMWIEFSRKEREQALDYEISVPRLDLSRLDSDNDSSALPTPPTQIRRINLDTSADNSTRKSVAIDHASTTAYLSQYKAKLQSFIRSTRVPQRLWRFMQSRQQATLPLPFGRFIRIGEIFALWIFQCCSSLCVLFMLVYATSSQSEKDNTFQLLEIFFNDVISFKRVPGQSSDIV